MAGGQKEEMGGGGGGGREMENIDNIKILHSKHFFPSSLPIPTSYMYVTSLLPNSLGYSDDIMKLGNDLGSERNLQTT